MSPPRDFREAFGVWITLKKEGRAGALARHVLLGRFGWCSCEICAEDQHRDPRRIVRADSAAPTAERTLKEIIESELLATENHLRAAGLYSELAHHTLYAPRGLCTCTRCRERAGAVL